jgi:putative membrane protein
MSLQSSFARQCEWNRYDQSGHLQAGNVMTQELKHAALGSEHRATEYLANERTFLAWIRTSLAIISLGFVVAKFSLWLRELAAGFDARIHTYQPGLSMPIGVTMMAVGGLVTVLAAWRYHSVNRAIERGVFSVDRGLVLLLTVVVTLLCLAMIAYLLVTATHT